MLIQVEVQDKHVEEFADLCVNKSDLFMRPYCGYWAFGLDMPEGWLVYEQGDDPQPLPEEWDAVEETFNKGLQLPDRWHILDKAAADRAFAEGVKRWGANWYDEKGDSETYDVVIQMALLGEVKYG